MSDPARAEQDEYRQLVLGLLEDAISGHFPLVDCNYVTLMAGPDALRARVLSCRHDHPASFNIQHFITFRSLRRSDPSDWTLYGVTIVHTDARSTYIGGMQGRAATLARETLERRGLDHVRVFADIDVGPPQPEHTPPGNLTTVAQDPSREFGHPAPAR